MSNYIDVVLVTPLEDRAALEICKAPAWSHLQNGDTVIVNATEECGEYVAQVILSHTFDEDSAEFDFLCACCGHIIGKELPRLKCKVIHREFEYNRGEEYE